MSSHVSLTKRAFFCRSVGALVLASALPVFAVDAGMKTLRGHVPAVIRSLRPVGSLSASTRLNLVVGLPLRNSQTLSNLLEQIYDPASPQYRHYLTPGQFNERFGPTEQDYQVVIAFARANHLTVTGRDPNRLIVDVNGSAADIEKTFHVALQTYQHPAESRTFYAPATEPSVEANMPILDVSGLDNFALPHPKIRRAAPVHPVANASGSGPGGSFAGTNYRTAYLPGVTLTGAGQSVGLFEFDGFYSNDIPAYESQTGLPKVPLQIVLLDGFDGNPSNSDGNEEVALDIEMAISMAPGLSNVVVYEAGPSGSALDILSAMSTNTAVRQFSCSWDFGSVSPTAMDQLFQKMETQGQTFLNASGDSGAYSGTIVQPNDDPYITIVGGTDLTTSGPGGAWVSETVWDWGDGTASSGGISTTYAIPTWQQGLDMSASQGSTTWRNVPDVALVADNVFIVADNGIQETISGTSVAAPLWAGFIALVNQEAAANGLGPVGFLNPAIYAIGRGAGYTAAFDDITTGNNTNNNPNQFFAVPGYDLCTGWGSPAGGSLILALAGPDALTITPGRGFGANGPAGGPFNVSSQTFMLTNSGTASFHWQLSTPPPWLNLSLSGGALAPGQSAAPVTISLNSAASQLGAGVYAATLSFTNLTSGLAQHRQVSLMVGQQLVQNGGFEAGDFAYWTLVGNNAAEDNFVDDGSYTGFTPHSGDYFAALGQLSTLASLYQTLPTLAGQPYLLSFWLCSADSAGGTTPNEFVVNWGARTLLDQLNVGAFGWTELQFVVQAAASSTALQFGFRNDPSYFALDDISVIPIPQPALQILSSANGAITLTWSTLPGLSYQVQYQSDVTSASWVNLGSVITATGSTATASDTLAAEGQRFYRVLLLP
jgi:hypothetical protein